MSAIEESTHRVEVSGKEGRRLGQVTATLAVPREYRRAATIAHGAGGDMNAALLVRVQRYLAARGTAAVRFNFLYTEARRRSPDRTAELEACWRSVSDWVRAELRPEQHLLGGKSMGGRIASHLVAQGHPCAGLVFLGYPLHPPGKPERLRKDHLPSIESPMLFIAGTRDPFSRLDLLQSVLEELGPRATLHVVEGGDHSFKVPKKSGKSDEEVLAEILGALDAWIDSVGGRAI